jgi:hypothetical protein
MKMTTHLHLVLRLRMRGAILSLHHISLRRGTQLSMKFPEWFYSKRTCILTAYWEGSTLKYSPSAAMHLAQWCCCCWKHFWNSCYGIAFSAFATFSWCLQYPEIFFPFEADFIFGNSQKSLGAKSEE